MSEIIVIGDLVVDTHVKINDASIECNLDGHNCKLCLDYAAKVPVADSFQTIGGNPANVALGLTKLGLDTTIISTIGDDSNGKFLISQLKKNKIKTTGINLNKKIKTRYSIVLNFKGERTILAYHAKINYHWPKKLPKANWVYYTSLSDGLAQLQKNLIKFLKQNKNVKLAFNPGSFQLKYDLALCQEMLLITDFLCVNLEEAQVLTGLKNTNDPKILISTLLKMGVKEMAITDGANGVYGGDSSGMWKMKAYDVPIVSKTGAGDSFSAGYLAAKIMGLSIIDCLVWGTANSCSVLGHFGVEQGQLNKNGIKKMIAKFKNVLPIKI